MLTFLGIVIAIVLGLALIQNLLLSFVIALVVSYFISPLISYLEGAGLSRIIAILIVYSFFTTLTGAVLWAFSPFFVTQLSALKSSLPQYVEDTTRLFNDFAVTIDGYTGGLFHIDFSDHIRGFLTRNSTELIDGLPQFLSTSATVLFLSPLLGFFILKDGRRASRELLRLVPNNIFELTLSLLHQINEQLSHYIRARLLESIIVGMVCFVGFLILGFPYALLLAAFAAVANLIPYIGPLFGAVPGIVLALINNSSGLMITMVILVYLAAQIIDTFFIIPMLVARIVNLHPVTVILAVVLGAQLMGVLGMFISIPLASTLKVTFVSVYNHLTDYTS